LTTRPPGSAATLSDPTLVNPTFVVDKPGDYVIQLIVNDGTVDSATDTVIISTLNSPPVANAGPDQTVDFPPGDGPGLSISVQLDGSRSSDVDGDALTFRWAVTSGPPQSQPTLSDSTLVNPTFVAFEPGIYVVPLIVNDGRLDSAPPDTVTITVEGPPTISDLTVELVELNSTTSCFNQTPPGSLYMLSFNYSDPDGDVRLNAGALVTELFRFSISNVFEEFDVTPFSTFGGNGLTGSISFRVCTQFGNATSIDRIVFLTDGGAHVSNSLASTTQRPTGAN
jgi:K319L-like, PKD domain